MNQTAAIPTSKRNRAPTQWVWRVLALIALGVWLAWLGSMSSRLVSYGSPDEAANALMARQYAQTGSFRLPTSLTPAQLAVFHPRSLTVRGSDLLPGSFVGAVQIWGLSLKLGSVGPVVLTLLVFALALWAWYRIARRYWSPAWAWTAVFLLTTFPAMAVYQTLPWFHAALFTSLLIITGFVALRFQEKQTWGRAVAVGLVYGLALCVRPVEVLFTGPALAVVMLVHTGKRRMFFATLGAALLVQVPWVVTGWKLFGSFLATGYTTAGVAVTTNSASGGFPIWHLFVPPGGWSWHFGTAFWQVMLLYPAASLMSVLALLLYFHRKFVSPVKILKIGAIILFGLFYLAYYGSLDLYPNTPLRVGAFSSYVRYWLPLMAAMSAGVIVFLRSVTKKRIIWAVPIIIVLVGVNVWTAIFHWSGGVVPFRRTLQHYDAIRAGVLRQTESNSLVISGQLDKVLEADRLVSYALPQTAGEWRLVGEIMNDRSVYVLNAGLAAHETDVVQAAGVGGLTIKSVGTVNGSPLWKVVPVPTPTP